MIKKILKDYKLKKDEENKIVELYEFCKDNLKTEKFRKTIEIIKELVNLKMDIDTIQASMLLYVPETKENVEWLENNVDKSVLDLIKEADRIYFSVRGEKNIDINKAKNTMKNMLIAASKDMRVLFIEIVSMLVDLRFLEEKFDSGEKTDIIRVAKIARDIYAPVAHKIGVYGIKGELEDIAFKVLENKEYEKITKSLSDSKEDREKNLKEAIRVIKEKIKEKNLEAEVKGRTKHISSIHKKIIDRDYNLDKIYDLVAIRIICQTKGECYDILGLVQENWRPVPGGFKDYIANPKENMYQSLHTIVFGPSGKYLEVQIRTEEMDRIAESGVAAHWQYKGYERDKKFETKLKWMKEIIEWKKKDDSLENLDIDFYDKHIMTFTPKGDVIQLPEGASVIDFAYAIHTDIGNKCERAKVNQKIVPLSYKLENGDIVEITMAKEPKPNRTWLSWVTTSKAKAKIRQFLQIKAQTTKGAKKKKEIKEKYKGVRTVEIGKDDARLAKCCKPIPGDEISAYVTTKRKVIVHKTDCGFFNKLNIPKNRYVNVTWGKKKGSFSISIKIESEDRSGLLQDILSKIKKIKLKINNISAKTLSKGRAQITIGAVIKDMKEYDNVVLKMKEIKGVDTVTR